MKKAVKMLFTSFIAAIAMANVLAAEMPKAAVTRLPALTLAPFSHSVYNGSLQEGKASRPLQVVMNFKALETTEEARPNGFLNYKCDFYLTFTGIKDGKFQAEGCCLAGNYGTFGWIVIPVDDMNLEEGVCYPVLEGYSEIVSSGVNLNITYKEVCDSIKDFTAAIYVAPKILEENPDFKVKLELKMTNPDTGASFTVGEPAIYDAADLMPDFMVSIPKADHVKINGGTPTYEQKEDIEILIKEFGANANVGSVKTGIKDAANADAVAAARLNLVDQGVSADDANRAAPSVSVTLSEIIIANDELARMIFDVTPSVAVGEKAAKISEFASDITFRLPVYSGEDRLLARVYHNDELMGLYEVKGEGSCKYVELSSKNFSKFSVEPVAAVAMIGEKKFATLADAVSAAEEDGIIRLANEVVLAETLVVPAEKRNLTLDLNGFAIVREEADAPAISNLGELTIKDSSAEGLGGIVGNLINSGNAYLTSGAYVGDIVNNEGAQIEVTGGAFLDAGVCDWVIEGYAASEFNAPVEEGETPFSYYVVAKLPTATVSPVPDAELNGNDLTFALKFKADSISDLQYDVFADWYADFVLTVNKDVVFNANGGEGVCGHLSGQYDEWSDNWVNVPFENVTVKAGEPLKIMEYAASLMGKAGLKLRYWEVYDVVQEFDCGVFFKPEFLEANPDLEVKLSLRMFNPKNENESYAVGIEYVFMPPKATDAVTVRDLNGAIVNCATMKEAIETVIAKGEDVNGGELTVLKDSEIEEDVTVKGTRNLFFDLGANKLKLADGKKFTLSGVNVVFTGEGELVGFSAENVVLDGNSVLTLTNSASAAALASEFESAGKYVTKNADDTWSVANKFELQIQMNGDKPSIGFLKDTRRAYTIETSYDLVEWESVEYAETTGDSEIAVPLKWQAPMSGQFFRVKAAFDAE